MAEQGSGKGKDPSDLFQVEKAAPSISPVEKIVLPPEEAMRQRVRRLALAAVAAVIFFVIANMILGWIHEARVQSALDAVIDEGTPRSVEHALGLLRDDPDPGVRARLLATAALGGDPEKLAEAQSLLAKDGDAEDPNKRIARIYLFLAKGDPTGAFVESEIPTKYGDQAAAFLYGRALASMGRGQYQQARNDIDQASAMRPEAPAIAALRARITSRTADPEQALAILDEADQGSVAVRIERARILGLERGQADEALALATKVRDSKEANSLQRAWADLIAGMLAYRRGAIGEAYRYAQAAAKRDLRADEPLLLGVAQLLLALDRPREAEVLLKQLSRGPSADLLGRVHTLSWWYAQQGDHRSGLATLSGAGFGPAKPMEPPLRALVVAETLISSPRQGERRRAIDLYQRAAKDRTWGVSAAKGLAEAQFEAGNPADAATTAMAALETHPNHLALVGVATQALIESGQVGAADSLTSAALQAFENEGWAHGNRARVLIVQRSHAEALEFLDRAVELAPKDAGLQSLRGDAARATGTLDIAKASYRAALALDPGEPRALTGLLALAMDSDDFDRAGELVEQMNASKVRDLPADRERLGYLIRTGAGHSGFGTVRAALARHKKDPGLRLEAARIYMQAGRFGRAAIAFQQAKRLGADPRLADTGAALAQGYDRRRRAAERSLEKAAEAPASGDPNTQVWELLVRGRLDLAEDRRGLALRRSKQAERIAPESADVFLLQADIDEARERSPEAALRKAANAPIPMPIAAGRLAVLLGPTAEGCEMASRYLKATRTGGRRTTRVRDVARECR